jgi:hypothetical protein
MIVLKTGQETRSNLQAIRLLMNVNGILTEDKRAAVRPASRAFFKYTENMNNINFAVDILY